MVRVFLPSSGVAVVLLAATAALGQTPPPPIASTGPSAKPASPSPAGSGAASRIKPVPQTETIEMDQTGPGEIVESPGIYFPGSYPAPPPPAASGHKWFHRRAASKKGHGNPGDSFQVPSAYPMAGMSTMGEGYFDDDSPGAFSPSPYAPTPKRRGLGHKSRWKQGNPDLSVYPVPGWSVSDDNPDGFVDPNCPKKKPCCLHRLFHHSRAGKNAPPRNEVPPQMGMDTETYDP